MQTERKRKGEGISIAWHGIHKKSTSANTFKQEQPKAMNST